MKKLLYATLFTACSSLGLMSCLNGDYDANPDTNNSSVGNPLNTGGTGGGNGGGGGGGSAVMAAKINGTQWTATTGIATTQLGLLLQGTNQSSQAMQLGIISYNGPATYSLSGGTTVAQYIDGSTQVVATSGEVVVAHETATNIDGTFHWEANGTSVTEGTFNIKK